MPLQILLKNSNHGNNLAGIDMIYLGHNLENIRSNIRDVSKIQCLNCKKVYMYSARKLSKIEDKLKIIITEKCTLV